MLATVSINSGTGPLSSHACPRPRLESATPGSSAAAEVPISTSARTRYNGTVAAVVGVTDTRPGRPHNRGHCGAPLRNAATLSQHATSSAFLAIAAVAVPSQRRRPVVMAVAETGLVPFWYVVEDASLTITFWPADVDMVKPVADTLVTVPDAPPAAGPERALDPPPPDPRGAAELVVEVALTIP
jgi:hypothetical protein